MSFKFLILNLSLRIQDYSIMADLNRQLFGFTHFHAGKYEHVILH